MIRWLRRRGARKEQAAATESVEVARLTAKADVIMNELESVISRMTDMLRDEHGTNR